MHKLNRFILALALTTLGNSTALLFADAITSVSCSTPTASLNVGSASCSAVGLYGYANASSTSSIVLPVSANQAAQIDVSSSASSFLGTVRAISSQSSAQSSADISIQFNTSGPLRSGYLELSFLQDAWSQPVYGSLSESLTVGSFTASPDGVNLVSVYIPVQLGSQFGFTYVESVMNNADAATGATFAAIGANISLQAFEADQTTAVQLFDPPVAAPEPATLGMMTVATLLALVLIHRVRTSSKI